MLADPNGAADIGPGEAGQAGGGEACQKGAAGGHVSRHPPR